MQNVKRETSYHQSNNTKLLSPTCTTTVQITHATITHMSQEKRTRNTFDLEDTFFFEAPILP